MELKISVSAKPIGFYSSGNIPNGPLVVLGYFHGGWDTKANKRGGRSLREPPPPPPLFFFFFLKLKLKDSI